MRAEIALARGEYAAALAMLTEIAAAAPGLASVELALYHAKTGGFAEAEALFEEALAATTGLSLSSCLGALGATPM